MKVHIFAGEALVFQCLIHIFTVSVKRYKIEVKEAFISFNLAPPCFLCPQTGGHYCFKCFYITENGGLSYQKEKRHIYHNLVIG